jgi:hypothetical protein
MSIPLRWTLHLLCCSLVLALTGSDGSAQTVSGSGQLGGGQKYAVTKCGRAKAPVGVAVTLNGDGTWSALVDGLIAYSGTYRAIGSSARKLDLDFDSGSLASLTGVAEIAASNICSASVVATSATEKKFALKLNKQGTKAKVVLKYVFTGTAGGSPGTAKYAFNVKGTWNQ